MSEYQTAYAKRKTNAPKDGTKLSGYVTAEENRPPRECGNCKWYGMVEQDHCSHPLVMIDPEVHGEHGKPKEVGEDDCCDNFQNRTKD